MRERVEHDRPGEARDRGAPQHPAARTAITPGGHVRDGEDEADNGDRGQDAGGDAHSLSAAPEREALYRGREDVAPGDLRVLAL